MHPFSSNNFLLFLKGFYYKYVVKTREGGIKDSVTGNVRVLAQQTFDLRSETQGQVMKSILLPFGRPVEVEEGQVLFELNESDLNRSLRKVLLMQNSPKRMERAQLASQQIEEKEFAAHSAIHQSGISNLEFEKKEKLRIP